MTPGIHSLSFEAYRKADGVSRSDLEWLRYSPAHYKAHKDGLIAEEEGPALTMGTIIHRAVLEPDTMEGAFYVKPEGMKFTTKEGIAWRDSHQDCPILSADDAATVRGVSASVNAHPMAKRLLAGSDFERSLFADDKGLLLKSRFDILPKSGNAIADLKTCERADLESVEKAIANYSLYRQAAFYGRVAKLLGMDRTAFVFIFVEKSPPYAVACYQLADDVIRAGASLVNRDLDLLRECIANDSWPGYGDTILPAAVPGWLLKQLEAIAA